MSGDEVQKDVHAAAVYLFAEPPDIIVGTISRSDFIIISYVISGVDER